MSGSFKDNQLGYKNGPKIQRRRNSETLHLSKCYVACWITLSPNFHHANSTENAHAEARKCTSYVRHIWQFACQITHHDMLFYSGSSNRHWPRKCVQSGECQNLNWSYLKLFTTINHQSIKTRDAQASLGYPTDVHNALLENVWCFKTGFRRASKCLHCH